MSRGESDWTPFKLNLVNTLQFDILFLLAFVGKVST